MIIDEMASYLRLKIAYALAAYGEITGFNVGGLWRFWCSTVGKWIKGQEKQGADRS